MVNVCRHGHRVHSTGGGRQVALCSIAVLHEHPANDGLTIPSYILSVLSSKDHSPPVFPGTWRGFRLLLLGPTWKVNRDK